MKSLLLSLIAIIAFHFFTSAQSHEVPMTMEPRWGNSPQFFQGYRKLKNKDVKRIMQYNEDAYAQYRSGRNRYVWGNVVGAIGGFGIGFGLAGAIMTKDNSYWLIAGGGLVTTVISFPIYKSGDKYMRKAVGIHNEGVQKYSFWDHKELRFTSSQNGIGLALRF